MKDSEFTYGQLARLAGNVYDIVRVLAAGMPVPSRRLLWSVHNYMALDKQRQYFQVSSNRSRMQIHWLCQLQDRE